jgi:hypothetical protein
VSDLCRDNDWRRVAGVERGALEARVSHLSGRALRFCASFILRFNTIQAMIDMGISLLHISFTICYSVYISAIHVSTLCMRRIHLLLSDHSAAK